MAYSQINLWPGKSRLKLCSDSIPDQEYHFRMKYLNEFYQLFNLSKIVLCFLLTSIPYGLVMGIMFATTVEDRIKLGIKMGLGFGAVVTAGIWLLFFLIYLLRR